MVAAKTTKRSNPEKVNPAMAQEALRWAKGDRRKAYSKYIVLTYKTGGWLSLIYSLDFNNEDLQAFYEKEGKK